MRRHLPRIALMLGNFVTGVCILTPAGMLPVLAEGLNASIRDTGLLVTYGAMVVCIASPLVAWLTTRIDRRLLLTVTLAVIAAGQMASAFAPDYTSVLVLRLAMLAVAAIYTPQAASTAALIVPASERASVIAFVFLGWSLAVAGGLPLVSFVAAHFGWRAVYGVAAAIALIPCTVLALTLPRGLRGAPLSLKSFGVIARHHKIMTLLLITVLHTAGQFSVFFYLAPLLRDLAGAGLQTIGLLFAIYGVAGFAGNMLATRIVLTLGTWATSGLFLVSMAIGLVLWSLGAGVMPAVVAAMVFWGLGFASTNSMQQARLVEAAPDLASATIGMNTSLLYVGQAIGSAIGGYLFSINYLHTVGLVGVGFVVLAIAVWLTTRDRRPAAKAS